MPAFVAQCLHSAPWKTILEERPVEISSVKQGTGDTSPVVDLVQNRKVLEVATQHSLLMSTVSA